MAIRGATSKVSEQPPAAPVQSTNSPRILLRDALVATPELLRVAQSVAAQTGGDIVEPGVRIKTHGRLYEKAHKDYAGRYDGIVDIAAASVVHPTVGAAYEGARALQRIAGDRIVRFRDRFENPTAVGYSDIVTNIAMANGHIVELQLHAAPMLEAKRAEQALYTLRRGIETAIPTAFEALQFDRRSTFIHGSNARVIAALHGAAVAVYEIAQEALAKDRQLTSKERAFLRDLTDPARYTN